MGKRKTLARAVVAGSLTAVTIGTGVPAFAAPTSAPDDYVFPYTCSGSFPVCTTEAGISDYTRFAGTETRLAEFSLINDEPPLEYGTYDNNGDFTRYGDSTITDVSQPRFYGSTYDYDEPQGGQFLDEADYDGYLGEARLESYVRADGVTDNHIVFTAPATIDPKSSRLSVQVLFTVTNRTTGEQKMGSAVVKVIDRMGGLVNREVTANDDCYSAGIDESIDMTPLDNDGVIETTFNPIPPGPEITASGGIAEARAVPSTCAVPGSLPPGATNADLLIGSLATADYQNYDGRTVRTENGTVTLQDDKKTITFTPDPGYAGGEQTFAYLVDDTKATTGSPQYSAVVTILVGAAATGPAAQGDTLVVPQASSAVVPVLDNDTSTDQPSLTIQSFTQPAHGSVTQEGQSLRYTHTDQTYTGNDSFTYTATDSTGQTSTATVQVSFSAAPAPTAAPDTITLTRGGNATGSVNVLLNDTSFDGTPLTLVSVTNGTHGLATVNGNDVVYTATDPTNPQVDTLTYVARDRLGHESTGTVNVAVNSQVTPPKAPTAGPDSLTVEQDTPGRVDVLQNDTSFDGTPLTVTSVGDAPHGTTKVVDNKVVYTPDTGFTGQDTFTYVITDQVGQTSTGTVTVTVTPAPTTANPTAGPDSLTVEQDTPGTVDVTSNDTSFDGTPLTVTSVGDAPHGTTKVVDNKVVYTPDTGFTGQDTFTYVITDRVGKETTGTVTVTVTPKAPTAGPDNLTVEQDTPGRVDVLQNDTSFDGSPLTLVSVGDAPHGTTLIVDGQVDYTPDQGFSGQDTFTYVIKDRVGKETTGVVTVNVTPKAPTAGPDNLTVEQDTPGTVDVTSNDTSFDGTPLTVTSVGDAPHGTTKVVDNKVVYTPDTGFTGQDTFTYVVKDRVGRETTGTVTVTVTPKSAPPTTKTPVTKTPVSTTSTPTTPTHLAYTGAETSELALVGFMLLAGGMTMTVVTRRRKGTMTS